MTENEAVKRIEDYIKECNYTWTVDAIFAEYVKLQNHCYISYTARDVIDNCVTPLKVLQAKALEEVQEYRKLGTVEECKAAVEKATAKKCIVESCPDFIRYKCPSCGNIQKIKYCYDYSSYGRILNNCSNCGQKLESEE